MGPDTRAAGSPLLSFSAAAAVAHGGSHSSEALRNVELVSQEEEEKCTDAITYVDRTTENGVLTGGAEESVLACCLP